jgi:hypothetical protein
MNKTSRKKLATVLYAPLNTQTAARFRERFGCYTQNVDVLRALLNHQLGEKTDLAVRTHVWNCYGCRSIYLALKAQADADDATIGKVRSITTKALAPSKASTSSIQLTPTDPETKRCPRCEAELPLDQFGVCRARKDGLNLYCKRCIRQKIALSRQALREYKKGRGASSDHTRVTLNSKPSLSSRRIARMLRKLSPADRVREAIRCGAHTQKQIAEVTKLPKDEVCDALANLLLWTREIRTQVVRHQRMYFINEEMETLQKAQSAAQKRNRSLNPSFSSTGVLMPGRKPSKRHGSESAQTTEEETKAKRLVK